MAFSPAKMVTMMLLLNLVLWTLDFDLGSSNPVYSFYTISGNGFSKFDSENDLSFGTDTSKSGTDVTITEALNDIKEIGITNPLQATLQSLNLLVFVAKFFLMLVSYALVGITLFAYNAGLPMPFILIAQIMYIFSLMQLTKGGSL